jgi:hypothetical protein
VRPPFGEGEEGNFHLANRSFHNILLIKCGFRNGDCGIGTENIKLDVFMNLIPHSAIRIPQWKDHGTGDRSRGNI